mmetsp:Transcript_35791/g.54264  ORF Transcript_35791/g.54264 Transcript_35791/m.54264 type:complete len:85 (-) Transcript_35791:1936-2190(-)
MPCFDEHILSEQQLEQHAFHKYLDYQKFYHVCERQMGLVNCMNVADSTWESPSLTSIFLWTFRDNTRKLQEKINAPKKSHFFSK